MSILDSVRRTIRDHRLLPHGTRVAVALSGGADSVALLFLLRDIAGAEGVHVAGAVHLNHQLRGADADADEAFCRELAHALALPIDVERVDVARRARETAASIEHAAHTERHAFFDRAAARLGATAVAVAHTKDDQAETFLLRLLRGAGPRGLSGMHPRAGLVVRPLLETSRSDVRDFLRERRITFREDASNADLEIPRNRIRHELLPLLDERFAPGIVDVLVREAAIAREDAAFLDAAAQRAAERLTSKGAREVTLDVAALLAEPAAIARRVIRLAQQMVAGPHRFVGFDATEAVRRFVVSKSTGQLDLPGHRVNRRGSHVVLTGSRGREKPPPAPDFLYQLQVPGRVLVPEAFCAISADMKGVPFGRGLDELLQAGERNEALIDAGRLAGPLSVRNRRPGDTFRPLGLGGRKKLQDFFVDAKIDRFAREIAPVIIDAAGRIVWVAGHALAEEFKVTNATKDVVILKRLPI